MTFDRAIEWVDETGVSPVVGVILMVAVTVILSATVGLFVFDLSGNLSNTQIQASASVDQKSLEVATAQLVTNNNADRIILKTPLGTEYNLSTADTQQFLAMENGANARLIGVVDGERVMFQTYEPQNGFTAEFTVTGVSGEDSDGDTEFETLQAAVDAVPAGTAEQEIIAVKQGTYDENVEVNKSVKIIGERGTVVLDANPEPVLNITTSGVTVKQLEIDGNNESLSNHQAPYGVYVAAGVSNVNLNGVVIRDTGTSATTASDSAGLYVAGDNVDVANSHIKGNEKHGIYIASGDATTHDMAGVLLNNTNPDLQYEVYVSPTAAGPFDASNIYWQDGTAPDSGDYSGEVAGTENYLTTPPQVTILGDGATDGTSGSGNATVAWHKDGFSARKSLDVTNPVDTTVNNYQIKLTVTYDSDMQSDFADLRFTASDGTELNYWIDRRYTSNTTSATVWVEANELPADGTTLYMYYDNASATSRSNGDATFVFYDNFESYSTGWQDKWDVVAGGSNFTHGDVNGDGDAELRSDSNNNDIRAVNPDTGNRVTGQNLAAETVSNSNGGAWNWINLRLVSKTDCCNGNWVQFSVRDTDANEQFDRVNTMDTAVGSDTEKNASSQSGVVRYGGTAYNGNLTTFMDLNTDNSRDVSVSHTDSTVESGEVGLTDFDGGVWIDEFIVRNYVDGTFGTSFGNEEKK